MTGLDGEGEPWGGGSTAVDLVVVIVVENSNSVWQQVQWPKQICPQDLQHLLVAGLLSSQETQFSEQCLTCITQFAELSLAMNLVFFFFFCVPGHARSSVW